MAKTTKPPKPAPKDRRKGKIAAAAATAGLMALAPTNPASADVDLEAEYSDTRPSSNSSSALIQEPSQPSAALLEHIDTAPLIPAYYADYQAESEILPSLYLEPETGPNFEHMLFAKYGLGTELTPAQEAAWIQLFAPLLKSEKPTVDQES